MEINDKTLAQDCVERFVRRFDASYRLLACFAALPLVLTPELLNYLSNRFLRGEVPWVAEVDLLLSELCSEVGYEQYMMSLPVRNYLLSEMRAKFGAQRQQEVALVLLDYVKHLARTKTAGSRPELEVQQWSAMLYIENQRADAVGQIAEAFRDLVSPAAADADAPLALDQTALARLVRITQELAPQLQDFPELVRYSKELSRLLAHPATVDKTPGEVEQSQGVVQLMGVELPSVAQVSQRMSAPLQKPATTETRQARDRTSTKAAAQPPTRPYEYDIFVSYAHADDEIPLGAKNGWVTTLVEELNRVLRRRLGGSGARIWMDHQLAANANVLDMLLATLRGSRILLLVMSPSYHQSAWCQRELGNFLAQSAAEKHKDNVFVVDFEPVPRETWPSALHALTTIRFWERGFTDQAPRPLGFPVPRPDEDNPYWRQLNELAYLIVESLRQNPARTSESRAAILLAETTEDLLDHRDAVAVFLRQQGVDVLPSVDYPRDSRAAFVSAVQRDFARSLAFVQLLGPYEGRKPPDDPATFVVLQADQARLLQQQRAVPILQWRTPEVEPERIANLTYRELVGRHTVQTGGLEQFKHEILRALQRQLPLAAAPPSPERRAMEPGSGTTRDIDSTDLYIYVNADQVDSDIASQVSDLLTDMGVTVFLSPAPDPEQPPEKIRSAQQELLQECSGVVLVYGRTPATWVQAQFAFTRRVIGPRKRGIWAALLDVAPENRQLSLRSPNLLTLDCRQGLDASKLARFVELLHQNGGSHA